MRLPERERGARFCSSIGGSWADLRLRREWTIGPCALHRPGTEEPSPDGERKGRASSPPIAAGSWRTMRGRYFDTLLLSLSERAAEHLHPGFFQAPHSSDSAWLPSAMPAISSSASTTYDFTVRANAWNAGFHRAGAPSRGTVGNFARDQDAIDRAGCVSNNVNASVARSVTRTSSQRLSSRAKPGDPGSRRPAGSHSTVPEPSSRPSSAVPTTAPATTPGSRPSITTASVKRETEHGSVPAPVKSRPPEAPPHPGRFAHLRSVPTGLRNATTSARIRRTVRSRCGQEHGN